MAKMYGVLDFTAWTASLYEIFLVVFLFRYLAVGQVD